MTISVDPDLFLRMANSVDTDQTDPVNDNVDPENEKQCRP